MSKGFIRLLSVLAAGIVFVLLCPPLQTNLFGRVLRMTSPEPSGFRLTIRDITDRAYSTMMAQTNRASESLLWDDRSTFTNYVLYVHYEKAVPVIEVQLTDKAGTHSEGYRFHTCVYDIRSDTMTFKRGMAAAIEN